MSGSEFFAVDMPAMSNMAERKQGSQKPIILPEGGSINRSKKGRQHAAAEMLAKEQVKKNGKHPVKARGQMGRSGEACERR